VIYQITGSNFFAWKPAGTDGSSTDIGPLYSWVVDILPHIDQQSMYNDFNRDRDSFDDGRSGDNMTRPTNLTISNTDLAILRCPNDETVQQSSGNLFYVVNTCSRSGAPTGSTGCPSAPGRRASRGPRSRSARWTRGAGPSRSSGPG
jgi:hypothetical protein